MTLDDNKTASVNKTADRTPTRGRSEHAHARDGLVAPPGLLTHHARGKPQPDLQADLHISVITDLHFSMDIGKRVHHRAELHPRRGPG
jgi:hypothetical protein